MGCNTPAFTSAESRLKAKRTRAEKRERGLSTYKILWADDGLWQQLAKEANIRLPQSHIPPSGIKLDKLAKQLGFEEGWQEEFFGVGWKTTTAAIKRENNAREDGKKYSMRCYVGHILEMWKERNK